MHPKKYFIVIFVCLTTLISYGQNTSDNFKNNLKFELTNLIYGDYSLTYERLVSKSSSLNFRVGYLKPFNRIFNKYELELKGKKNGFDTSFEYRYYINPNYKSETIGFYLAPYLRYANLKINFIDEIQITPFSVGFKYSNIGAGLQLGIQGTLRESLFFKGKMVGYLKRVVYDFHLIGVGIDYHTLKLTYHEMKNPDDFDYGTITNDIEEYFDKVPFLSRKLDFGYFNNFLSVKLPMVLPGLRAGFSVGYSF